MKPICFALVGGGWRAEFYLRVAQAMPETFVVDGMVVRDLHKGLELERTWGIKTYRSIEELLQRSSPHSS